MAHPNREHWYDLSCCRHKQYFELANGTVVPNLGDASYYRFAKKRRLYANLAGAREAVARLEPPPVEPSALLPCAGGLRSTTSQLVLRMLCAKAAAACVPRWLCAFTLDAATLHYT